MTPEQITLVKESWVKLVPIRDRAATLFYERLFSLDPPLQKLFSGDMAEQGQKLMVTISTVVTSLDKLELILPVIKDLGRRHVGYGVKDSDYDNVGAALLWTLEQGLGDTFTSDIKQAWTEAYTLLATVMTDAAKEVETGQGLAQQ